MPSSEQRPRPGPHYWRRNLQLTAVLLAIWFIVTFVVAYAARDLAFNFFGWPFSFWMAAQGAPVIFLVLVWVYARAMDRLDREYDVGEADEE